MTHAELVMRAAQWLDGAKRCAVVATEISTVSQTGEIPDAIGWSYGRSHLVECKATRSDFLADNGKPFRADPTLGLGDFRWYMTPPGLVSPDELPDGWGLLEVRPRGVRVVRASAHAEHTYLPPFAGNGFGERAILLSILRRARGDFTVSGKRTTISLADAEEGELWEASA